MNWEKGCIWFNNVFYIFVRNNTMVKANIISGDQNTIREVSDLVGASCPDINIDAFASDLKSGVHSINTHLPDLLIYKYKFGLN
nr:hypothetical protein [Bacteroidota bacterium]